ncbi:MAG TPA: metallopeptidase TldD-related protein [Trebonia sp.]|nr:metallopeptidase TldD-related protein [Trebonia sp.]
MLPPLDADQTMEALEVALKSAAADELEIAVLARAVEYTRFAGQVIHQPQDITEVQYLVRALVNGHPYRVATATAAGLGPAVAAAADGARARAGIAAASGRAGAAGRVSLAGPPQPDSGTAGIHWYDDTAGYDAGTRSALAKAAMADAIAAGGEAAGMLGRAVTQQLVATTSGIRRATAATEASGALTVTTDDGTSHWIDLSRSAARLDVARSVTRAIAQARASRGRTELPAGRYEVVLGAEAMGELLGFLPDLGFSGTLAAAGIGITGRAGQQAASPLVAVADDGGADIGLPIGFDIEGVTKRRVDFFSGGRVGEPVTDLATGAALRRPSTGHAHIAREQVPEPTAANIVMSPGSHSEDELIAHVERGVYLQRFWYTRLVDRMTATITGVTRDACFLIEDGRLTTPLAGLRFTESVLGVLAGVEAVGSGVRSQPIMNVWNGVVSAPAVRSRAFRLGAAPIEAAPIEAAPEEGAS